MYNRLSNCHNKFQGAFPRVLCVCSAGLLRAPTLAWVLSNPPYNCNTRAAGSCEDFALVPVDKVLLEWAQHIVAVNRHNLEELVNNKDFEWETAVAPNKKIWVLDVPDSFSYRDPELVQAIRDELERCKFSTDTTGDPQTGICDGTLPAN